MIFIRKTCFFGFDLLKFRAIIYIIILLRQRKHVQNYIVFFVWEYVFFKLQNFVLWQDPPPKNLLYPLKLRSSLYKHKDFDARKSFSRLPDQRLFSDKSHIWRSKEIFKDFPDQRVIHVTHPFWDTTSLPVMIFWKLKIWTGSLLKNECWTLLSRRVRVHFPRHTVCINNGRRYFLSEESW